MIELFIDLTSNVQWFIDEICGAVSVVTWL